MATPDLMTGVWDDSRLTGAELVALLKQHSSLEPGLCKGRGHLERLKLASQDLLCFLGLSVTSFRMLSCFERTELLNRRLPEVFESKGGEDVRPELAEVIQAVGRRVRPGSEATGTTISSQPAPADATSEESKSADGKRSSAGSSDMSSSAEWQDDDHQAETSNISERCECLSDKQ